MHSGGAVQALSGHKVNDSIEERETCVYIYKKDANFSELMVFGGDSDHKQASSHCGYGGQVLPGCCENGIMSDVLSFGSNRLCTLRENDQK